jgi:hypothetical protein
LRKRTRSDCSRWAQGYNRFSCVSNNPVNTTDPSGYLSFKDVLKIVIVVVAAVVTAGAAAGAVYAAGTAGAGATGALAGSVAAGTMSATPEKGSNPKA